MAETPEEGGVPAPQTAAPASPGGGRAARQWPEQKESSLRALLRGVERDKSYTPYIRALHRMSHRFGSDWARVGATLDLSIGVLGAAEDQTAVGEIARAYDLAALESPEGLDLLIFVLRPLRAREEISRSMLARFRDYADKVPSCVLFIGDASDKQFYAQVLAKADLVVTVGATSSDAPNEINQYFAPIDLRRYNIFNKIGAQSRRDMQRPDAVIGDLQDFVKNTARDSSAFFAQFPQSLIYENHYESRNNDNKLHVPEQVRNLQRIDLDAETGLLKIAKFFWVAGGPQDLSARQVDTLSRAVASGCAPVVASAAEQAAFAKLGLETLALDQPIPPLISFLKTQQRNYETVSCANSMARLVALAAEQLVDEFDADAITEAFHPGFTALVPTMRPELVPFILQLLAEQTYSGDVQAILLCNFEDRQLPERAGLEARYPFAKFIFFGDRAPIGYMLNTGVDACETPYWGKFDDDDYYAPRYIESMMNIRQSIDFDLAGVDGSFMYFEGSDRLILTNMNANIPCEDFRGGTLVAKKSTTLRFTESHKGMVDVMFVRETASSGRVTVAGGLFNYMQVRRADKTKHTWTLDDSLIPEHGVSSRGLNLAMVAL